MTTDPDEYWKSVVRKLSRVQGMAPLTTEEADAAFNTAPNIPLSKQQIRSIVDSVTSGELRSWESADNDAWQDTDDLQGISEDMLQLHRNKGELDPEAAEREKRLEEGLLSDDEPEQNDELEGDSESA